MTDLLKRTGAVLGCVLPCAGKMVVYQNTVYFAAEDGGLFELKHLLEPNEKGETIELVPVELA